MGLKSMLDEMQKNRPQAGSHFNALNPTGGQEMAGNQAAVNNQASGAANLKAGLSAMYDQTFREVNSEMARKATQWKIAAAVQSQFATGLYSGIAMETWQDHIVDRAAQFVAAQAQLNRGNVVTSEMMAEQRKVACDRMGEPRCSTRCYVARRHVEPERGGKLTPWKMQRDNVKPRSMPFWIAASPEPGVFAFSSVAGETSVPSGSLVERANAHLRPRWR